MNLACIPVQGQETSEDECPATEYTTTTDGSTTTEQSTTDSSTTGPTTTEETTTGPTTTEETTTGPTTTEETTTGPTTTEETTTGQTTTEETTTGPTTTEETTTGPTTTEETTTGPTTTEETTTGPTTTEETTTGPTTTEETTTGPTTTEETTTGPTTTEETTTGLTTTEESTTGPTTTERKKESTTGPTTTEETTTGPTTTEETTTGPTTTEETTTGPTTTEETTTGPTTTEETTTGPTTTEETTTGPTTTEETTTGPTTTEETTTGPTTTEETTTGLTTTEESTTGPTTTEETTTGPTTTEETTTGPTTTEETTTGPTTTEETTTGPTTTEETTTGLTTTEESTTGPTTTEETTTGPTTTEETTTGPTTTEETTTGPTTTEETTTGPTTTEETTTGLTTTEESTTGPTTTEETTTGPTTTEETTTGPTTTEETTTGPTTTEETTTGSTTTEETTTGPTTTEETTTGSTTTEKTTTGPTTTEGTTTGPTTTEETTTGPTTTEETTTGPTTTEETTTGLTTTEESTTGTEESTTTPTTITDGSVGTPITLKPAAKFRQPCITSTTVPVPTTNSTTMTPTTPRTTTSTPPSCRSCDVKCIATDARNRTWDPCPGETQTKNCSEGADGTEVWTCDCDGRFTTPQPNDSGCKSRWLKEALELAENIQDLHINQNITEMIRGNTRPNYYGHEIEDVLVGLLPTVVQKASNLTHLVEEFKPIADDVVNITYIVTQFSEPWQGLDNKNRSRFATILLQNIESVSFNLTGISSCDPTSSTRMEEFIHHIYLNETYFVTSALISNDVSDDRPEFPKFNMSKGTVLRLPPNWGREISGKVDWTGSLIDAEYASYILPLQSEGNRETIYNGNLISFTVSRTRSSCDSIDEDRKVELNFTNGPGVQIIFPHRVEAWGDKTANLHRDLKPGEERMAALGSARCVFWDTVNLTWSTEGCKVIASTPFETTCECDHLTSFAILMDLHNYRTACFIFGFLTHYVFLAAFCWMALEGWYLYKVIINVFNNVLPRRSWIYNLIGYGVPLVMVGITLLIGYIFGEGDVYGGEVCWLAGSYIWAFNGPVLIVVVANISILTICMVTAHRVRKSRQFPMLKRRVSSLSTYNGKLTGLQVAE
ncbi:Polysialoglycoprotein [Folsomia candida]|uniref:Polysialoglycoprotein n=1 Tax=Folsomia candida TaxID=158441 RepID=A0A226E0Z3_FOLCA|nr:Polysialoglycoprotein [Folsomia candida]